MNHVLGKIALNSQDLSPQNSSAKLNMQDMLCKIILIYQGVSPQTS